MTSHPEQSNTERMNALYDKRIKDKTPLTPKKIRDGLMVAGMAALAAAEAGAVFGKDDDMFADISIESDAHNAQAAATEAKNPRIEVSLEETPKPQGIKDIDASE